MKNICLILLFTVPIISFSEEEFNYESYIAKGACPFECCTYRDWYSKTEITLYEGPSVKSGIMRKIPKNTRVTALTGEVHLKPAEFRFFEPHWHGYKAGDSIWLLDDLGEAEFRAWDGKKYIQVHYIGENGWYNPDLCTDNDPWKPINCSGKLEEKIQATWWAKIKLSDGKLGWTKQPEHFANTDACG